MQVDIKHGDCLNLMTNIPDASVDLILCDLPYGTTQCKWDSCIDLERLWGEYLRVAKENAPILLFSQQPFSATLIMSNPKMFRYEWIWYKNKATGWLNSKKMPLKAHENILCFYRKLPKYNPQMRTHDFGGNPFQGRTPYRPRGVYQASHYGRYKSPTYKELGEERLPIDIVNFQAPDCEKGLHPTQKPISLLEYLINTYTDEGDTVLDNCMGSGSTGIAAINCNRNFIGIEMDADYYTIAKERIGSHLANKEVCV